MEERFFLRHLAEQGLEMRFPERTLRSHADFQDWYRGIGKTIRANTHDVSGLRVTPVGKDSFHIDLFVWWRAVSREGKPTLHASPSKLGGGQPERHVYRPAPRGRDAIGHSEARVGRISIGVLKFFAYPTQKGSIQDFESTRE